MRRAAAARTLVAVLGMAGALASCTAPSGACGADTLLAGEPDATSATLPDDLTVDLSSVRVLHAADEVLDGDVLLARSPDGDQICLVLVPSDQAWAVGCGGGTRVEVDTGDVAAMVTGLVIEEDDLDDGWIVVADGCLAVRP